MSGEEIRKERRKKGEHRHKKKNLGHIWKFVCNLFTHKRKPPTFDAGQKEARLSLFLFFKGSVRVCVLSLSLYRVGLLHKDREAEKITIEFV